MNYRLNLSNVIDRIYIFVSILILFKFFYLISDSGSILLKGNTDGRYDMLITFSIVYLLMQAMLNHGKLYKGRYYKIAISFIVFILIECLYTMLRYGQIITTFAPTKFYYFAIFVYFAYAHVFKKLYNFRIFVRTLAICTIIMCILLLYQRIYYINTGNLFLYTDAIRANTLIYEIRNSGLRFSAGSGIVVFSTIFFTAYALYKKEKNTVWNYLYMSTIALGYLTILFVYQSRVQIIITFVVLAWNVINLDIKNIRLKYFYIIAILTVIIVAISANGVILNQIIGVSVSEGSYWARQGAIEYYLKVFANNIFLGLGLVVSNSSELNTLVHGLSGYYYYSDVGMIGNLAEFGIFILFWFCLYIKRMLKTRKILNGCEKNIATNMILMISVFTFSTLSVFNNGRFLMIPLSMAIMNYFEYNKQLENKVENFRS